MPGSAEELNGPKTAERLLALLERTRLGESSEPLEVGAAIGLAIRTAHVLALERLAGVAAEFPATIQALLTAPDPVVDTARDALEDTQGVLDFRDLIDLLSVTGLECVAPRLHRGWQDKVQSCQTARRAAQGAVGFGIDGERRRSLLAGLAIYHRLFVFPPPVRPDVEDARAALAGLLRLVEQLRSAG